MVGWRSARRRDALLEDARGSVAPERRGLERYARALARGRRVRGRPLASGPHGMLVELRGVLGHVAKGELAVGDPGTSRHWEGWVLALGEDLVHLTSRRPSERGDEDAVREAEVLSSGKAGARVRLMDDGSTGVVPWDELSWHPLLEIPRLEHGVRLRGRVVGLSLEGAVLSPRSVAPSPWPAIALALTSGTRVPAVIEAVSGDMARVRTQRAPRAVALLRTDRLPPAATPGDSCTATVTGVDPIAARLDLDHEPVRDLDDRPRDPPPGPGARTQEPPAPGTAASGSRS